MRVLSSCDGDMDGEWKSRALSLSLSVLHTRRPALHSTPAVKKEDKKEKAAHAPAREAGCSSPTLSTPLPSPLSPLSPLAPFFLDPPPPALFSIHVANVMWRSTFCSAPTAGVLSSFCTPWEVARLAAYRYRT